MSAAVVCELCGALLRFDASTKRCWCAEAVSAGHPWSELCDEGDDGPCPNFYGPEEIARYEVETIDGLAFSRGFEGHRCAECAAIQDEAVASSRRCEVLSRRDAAA